MLDEDDPPLLEFSELEDDDELLLLDSFAPLAPFDSPPAFSFDPLSALDDSVVEDPVDDEPDYPAFYDPVEDPEAPEDPVDYEEVVVVELDELELEDFNPYTPVLAYPIYGWPVHPYALNLQLIDDEPELGSGIDFFETIAGTDTILFETTFSPASSLPPAALTA